MKTVISLVTFCVACHATADMQKIQYSYDDSDAEYSLVSFVESGTAIQAIVQREGAYFTSYTKVELDCANRNARHTGMYNSLEGLENVQFDQMQERIVEGSIAGEVGKMLCKGTTLSASQADNPPAEEQTDDRT
ncbi:MULTISPECIES: hypothetical protein [unclassified Pseudomonas]|uniref:hypothetical protein n=1 Tax=unclassified Pseudomonas TaxID=196821 RepID=UPI001199C89A|nr:MULTISPECIES: hypothetical protein [unclassified Pseudomonas]TWC06671.1 hypothetical protein FBY00_15010 [Pseudomonas sp. SJZ075]TWC16022.1 hypothetical protein FBX99_12120 [Pseudomonas sp. SJZ074]TWC28320.1 hypothetical protein FBY02_13115 [Pseudomonas sp. SJZ078]TWC34435.1 hypothetical protein FBY06_12184 [Pseudomonas sp. SJZ085]TWC45416.1 hypothetical protein FBY11_15110 [Pseudomonas sp. SJZ124]